MNELRDGHAPQVLENIQDLSISDRNKEIARRALLGETYKSVGQDFGISQERVRTIYVSATRAAINITKKANMPFPENLGLSIRAYNFVRNMGVSEEELRQCLSTYDGFKSLQDNSSNFGKKSIAELYAALDMPIPSWMDPSRPKIGNIRSWVDRWVAGEISAESAMRGISGITNSKP